MTDYEIKNTAFRLCLKYKDGDKEAIDRLYYLVALATLQEREACLQDIQDERDSWKNGRNDIGVMVCDYIVQAIKKRGMQ